MERKPSEIFLDLWHQVSLEQMEREDFTECAEALAVIKDLEGMKARADEFFEDMKKHISTFEIPEIEEEDAGEDPEEKNAEEPEEIQIDQHTYEIVEPAKKQDEKPITWTDKQHALKQRKQEIKARLEEARRNTVSGPTLAEAAGVEYAKIYAIRNAGQVTIQTYEKVAKGLEKLGY